MNHDYLDRFSRLESPIHRMGASTKLLGLLGVTIGLLFVPTGHLRFLLVIGMILFLVAMVSRVPLKYLAQRVLLLEPFAVGATLFALVQEDGISRFLWLLARVTLSLFALIIFASTTPFASVLAQLKKWSMPSLLVTVMALMYRYVFLLVDEAERMARARKGRSFSKERMRMWGQITTMIAQLFMRSTERGERVLAAMQSRGWR